jgi:putative endonuclease
MNHRTGRNGEQLALEFMVGQGYALVERNYRCRFGEIDLIMLLEKTLVFIEVKTRFSSRYGLPREAVTIPKQRVIYQTAAQYIQRYNIKNLVFRFDVIEVYQDHHPAKIVHLPNAFVYRL